MSPSAAFHVVDLHDSNTALRVQWRSAPGAHARPVDAALLDRIARQVTVLAAAERHAGVARDAVVSGLLAPSGPGLAAAQRALGEALYELLDGPDRALARRLEGGAWRSHSIAMCPLWPTWASWRWAPREVVPCTG